MVSIMVCDDSHFWCMRNFWRLRTAVVCEVGRHWSKWDLNLSDMNPIGKNLSKFDSLISPWLSPDFTLQGKYWCTQIHKIKFTNTNTKCDSLISSWLPHKISHGRAREAWTANLDGVNCQSAHQGDGDDDDDEFSSLQYNSWWTMIRRTKTCDHGMSPLIEQWS